jgi:hypothetical protein
VVKKAQVNMPIKDKNNNILTTEREQYLRWKEHFQEVLSRKDPDELTFISEAPIDLEIVTDPPSRLEIQKAIKSLEKQEGTRHRPTKCRTFKDRSSSCSGYFTPSIPQNMGKSCYI